MKKFFATLKFILISIVFLNLLCFAYFFLTSKPFQKFHSQKNIQILFLSTEAKNIKTIYLFDYSFQKQEIFIFPLSSKNKLLNYKNSSYLFLSDIYRGIYYQNKKDLEKSTIAFMQKFNEIFDQKIEYFIHFSSSDIANINKNFEINLSYSDLTKPNSDDLAIYAKYKNWMLFLENINYENILKSKFLRKYFFKQFHKNIDLDQYFITGNLTKADFFYLLTKFYKLKTQNINFVGVPDVLNDGDRSFINEFLSVEKNDGNEKVIVEVLNGSGRGGKAVEIARFLRSENIDVQLWGNYPNIVEETIVIDRKGYLDNAKKVHEILKTGVFLSRKEKNSFYDLTIILGENKNFVVRTEK